MSFFELVFAGEASSDFILAVYLYRFILLVAGGKDLIPPIAARTHRVSSKDLQSGWNRKRASFMRKKKAHSKLIRVLWINV